MMQPDETTVQLEVEALLQEAQAEFERGFDIEELLARVFVRLSPVAVKMLAVRGMAATVAARAHRANICTCEHVHPADDDEGD